VDPQAVHDYLLGRPGITRVHDLHIWAMDTSEVALTAHLVMPSGHADDAFLKDTSDQLHERFDITHTTLQVVNVPFTRPCGDWPAATGAKAAPESTGI
jgi:cobalt-zinc-cadmium efflux system protein